MNQNFVTVEDAFTALSNPQDPDWMAAFSFLASHPDTEKMMLETFQDTLKEMGVEPGGLDPQTGEPVYTLTDVARALGIPETELDTALRSDDSVD